MQKLIIFGDGKISDVISYYIDKYTKYEIEAYTVDDKYVKKNNFRGKKLVPFSNIEKYYSPLKYKVFVAIGYQNLNKLREDKCREVEEKGYKLFSYIGKTNGISRDLVYKDNCFVMDGALIHPNVEIGKNVFIWSGALVGHHSIIGNNSWLTSSCNISGDVIVGKNCFFALNASIGNSLKIGQYCFFGVNSLITKCVEDNSVFIESSTNKFRLSSSQFIRLSNKAI